MRSLVLSTAALVLLCGSRPFRSPKDLCELGRVDRSRASSFSCMGCHDGSTARPAHVRGGYAQDLEGLAPVTDFDGVNGSHPVEVDYELARMRRPSVLGPAVFLPRNLPLAGGKVTCATCHDGASRYPARTAMSMEGSAMCFACHQDY